MPSIYLTEKNAELLEDVNRNITTIKRRYKAIVDYAKRNNYDEKEIYAINHFSQSLIEPLRNLKVKSNRDLRSYLLRRLKEQEIWLSYDTSSIKGLKKLAKERQAKFWKTDKHISQTMINKMWRVLDELKYDYPILFTEFDSLTIISTIREMTLQNKYLSFEKLLNKILQELNSMRSSRGMNDNEAKRNINSKPKL